LWDKDKILDEVVSSEELDIHEILKYDKNWGAKDSKFQWISLYGAHPGYSGKNTKFMNKTPGKHSTWKGRILAEYFVRDTKYPRSGVEAIEEKYIVKARNNYIDRYYQFKLFLKFGEGICLPYKENFRVAIKIAQHQWKSKPPKQAGPEYNLWNETIEGDFTMA
jgi:hypothetical protein